MKKMVDGLEHFPGVHCCSTALRDIMKFHGYAFSEALCFGLASGLGFTYWKDDRITPSRCVIGRAEWIAPYFFQNIGMPFNWEPEEKFPWEALKACIDKDVPVILLTDIYYLEYFNSSTHFAGHCVVLGGYDEEEKVVFLGDTERPGWQVASIDSLAAAMDSRALPVSIKNHWQQFPEVTIKNLPESVTNALLRQCRQMLQPTQQISGLPGMKLFVEDLKSWTTNVKDLTWCFRFAYQVIEQRGTGGGNFRGLYSDFLFEADQLLPHLALEQYAVRAMKLSSQWSELAYIFKELSVAYSDTKFQEALTLSDTIYTAEKEFYQGLAKNLNVSF